MFVFFFPGKIFLKSSVVCKNDKQQIWLPTNHINKLTLKFLKSVDTKQFVM